jgi:hypothetical protein
MVTQVAEVMQSNQSTTCLPPAVLHDALEHLNSEADELESNSLPRGGFTDVGKHTGITPPNTAWPLVREALKVGGNKGWSADVCALCL